MAQTLQTSVAYFYEGLEGDADLATVLQEGSTQAFLTSQDGTERAHAFLAIEHPRVRRRILELVRAIGRRTELTVA